MRKFKKYLKNRWLLIGVIGAIIFTFFIFKWIYQHSSITLNQKKYICLPLSKDNKSNLIALSILVEGYTDTRDMSMKRYEKELNNCGTEKEFEILPEHRKIMPLDHQDTLDKVNEMLSALPYTIKDFQECRDTLKKDMQDSEDESNSEINRWSNEVDKLLSKNNCHLISK